MRYESLTVLIPSHSIEDLPTDLPEQQAEGLLNAFAVVWHPLLLDSAGVMPNWHRADEPPQEIENRLFIIPAVSRDWLPCQWIEHARDQGAVLITDVSERQEMVRAVLGPLGDSRVTELDEDFLALGYCYLMLEILTRQMRYFNEIDQRRLGNEAVSAARAALAGDRKAAESHLMICFEMLREGRERFYPVDCYLVDFCLLTQEMAQDHWSNLVRSERIVNFLATVQDLQAIGAERPDDIAQLRARWRDGKQEIVGGEWAELPNALLPLETVLPSFQRGLSSVEQLCGRRPTAWGRRKYGLGIQIPQILDKLGYEGALHFVIDDGLYPDEEQGKHRWEGCDGSVIDAISRIPLAADSASGMLRFPQRMAESMDYDHAALLVLARWPKLQTPWLEDLHRIERYAPVLGRFVTFSDFFRTTETPGRIARHKAGDYLSPHLVGAVAREESDPISRYSREWDRHHRIQEAIWFAGMANLLRGRSINCHDVTQIERLGDKTYRDQSDLEDWMDRLESASQDSAEQLARTIVAERGHTAGLLIPNTCSFARRAIVACPPSIAPREGVPSVIGRQWNNDTCTLVVDLPPSGFVWMPTVNDDRPESSAGRVPLAEQGVLRNEIFEVRLSDVTGGVAQVKTYRRSPNRISQQLAFRFPREMTVKSGEGDEVSQHKTWYSEMRMTESEVISDGPIRGEVETKGVLVDPTNEAVIAGFTQRVRVWRGLPLIEIDAEIEPERLPEGDPWSNFFAMRWAWNDSTAALTCSVQEGAHPVTADRFEASHFVEIADDDERRTTLHWLGLPFHRKTGPRMLDTLLITAGETRRRFRFVVAIDDAFPMERSRDLWHPPLPVVIPDGPDQPLSGWFFHVDHRNVQITRMMPSSTGMIEESDNPPTTTESHGETAGTPAGLLGCKLRLRETEGRACSTTIRCFRPPQRARQCDLLNRPVTDLTVKDDAVTVSLTAYEICDLELEFV